MSVQVAVCAATFAAGQGGIARVARMSYAALVEAGYDARGISYLDNAPPDFARVPVPATARRSKLRFAALCHRAAVRATHCLYDSAGVARAHPRLPGFKRPYALWIHGLEVWGEMRRDHARAIRRADMVLVNSRHTLERYESDHGPLPAARVCWLATETDEPPQRAADFSGPPVALILGRFDPAERGKGHEELLACWPGVVAASRNARLVIAGAGAGFDTIRARVRASPVAASIDVMGFVPESEIPALLQRAHVLVMPSRQEGFGITYVEAMRFGLPVVASVHDAGQEINVDGQTGFNIDLTRKDELADRLTLLLREPGTAAAMGKAGIQRWQNHFRYSHFADRFLHLWGEFACAEPTTAGLHQAIVEEPRCRVPAEGAQINIT